MVTTANEQPNDTATKGMFAGENGGLGRSAKIE